MKNYKSYKSIKTDNYEVDQTDLQAAENLIKRNPNARLFSICIGYKVAGLFSGNYIKTQ